MYGLEDETSDYSLPRKFYKGFLSSPILDTPRHAFLKYQRKTALEGRVSLYRTMYQRTDISPEEVMSLGVVDMDSWLERRLWTPRDIVDAELMDPHMLPELFSFLDTPSGELDGELELSSAESSRILATYKPALDRLGDQWRAVIGRMESVSSEARRWYRVYVRMNRAISSLRESEYEGFNRPCEYVKLEDLTILVGRGITCIRKKGKKALILTREQLEAYKDAAYNRFMAYLSNQALGGIIKEEVISRVIGWQEECLAHYSNNGYDLIKGIESLMRAWCTALTCRIFKDAPYTRMLDKMRLKEGKLNDNTPCTDLIDQIVREEARDVVTSVELFGLQKLSGHPIINAKRGGASAALHALTPDQTTGGDAERIRGSLCHLILEGYIAKHASWPSGMLFRDKVDAAGKKKRTRLEYMFREKDMRITWGKYPITDWEYVRFPAFLEFDHMEDHWLETLDDKSISLPRSMKQYAWDKGGGVKIPTRRLLIAIFSDPSFSPREIFRAISRRELHPDWLIVSLYPKEREFKLEARMYAMLHYKMRYVMVVTEHNLATKLFPYLKCQTMTLPRNETLGILHDMTRRAGTEDTVLVEVDYARWNLAMRKMSVYRCGDVANDCFGVIGYYTFVHDLFENSIIMVRVGNERPPGIENDIYHEIPAVVPFSDYVWGSGVGDGSKRHLGGFEGIAQKLWTLFTYAMVNLAVTRTGGQFLMIGQGDNQILAVTYHMPETTEEGRRTLLVAYKDELLQYIKEEADKVGQVVKPDECVESTTVLSYSKVLFINGCQIGTCLKLFMKISSSSMEDFPSIVSEIASIFSSALGASDECNETLVAYWVGLLVAHLHLMSTLRGGRALTEGLTKGVSVKDRTSFCEYVLTTPSDFGGWEILTPLSFIYKGGGDPLGKALAAVLLRTGDIASKTRAEILSGKIRDSTTNARVLIDDPYSIPIKRTAKPASSVAKATAEYLKSIIVNPELREVVSLIETGYEESIYQTALSLRPLNPLIGYDLVRATPVGTWMTVKKSFVTTRTVQSEVRKGSSVTDRVVSSEQGQHTHMLNKFASLPTGTYRWGKTIYALAESLRQWWVPICGCAPEGVSCLSPFDFLISTGAPSAANCGIGVIVRPGTARTLKRGRRELYLGRDTQEHMSWYGVKVTGEGAPEKAIRSLMKISGYLNQDVTTLAALNVLVRSRTDSSYTHLLTLAPRKTGGTLAHRYRSDRGSAGASICGPSGFSSWCTLSSDNSGFLAGGERDYPVMFQEFFVYLIGVARYHALSTGKALAFIAHIGETSRPLPEIQEEGMTIGAIPQSVPLSATSTRIIYMPGMELRLIAGAPYTGVSRLLSLSPVNDLARHDLLVVACGVLRPWLRSSGISAKVADGLISTIPPLPLDIAEVQAIGVDVIIDALANAIVTSVITIDLRKAVSRRWERYRRDLTIPRLAGAVARLLAPIITHPAFRSTRLIGNVIGSARLSYERGGGIEDRVTIVILRKCARLIRRPRELLETCDLFFADTHTEERLRRLQERSSIAIYVHRASGEEIKNQVVSDIAGVIGELTQEGCSSDEQVRAGLIVALENVGRANIPSLTALLPTALGKFKIIETSYATREVTRWVRRSNPWRAKKVTPISLAVAPSEGVRAPKASAMTLRTYRALTSFSGLSVLRNRMISRWERGTLASDSPIEAWRGVAHYVAGAACIIIGCGTGGAAAMLLIAGARYVYGVDLLEHLPDIEPGNYVPAAVAEVGGGDRFVELRTCWSCDRGVDDGEVQREIRDVAEKEEGVIVVLDHLVDEEAPLGRIEWLVGKEWIQLLIVRVVCSEEDAYALASDLGAAANGEMCLIYRDTHRSYHLVIDKLARHAHRTSHVSRIQDTPIIAEEQRTTPDPRDVIDRLVGLCMVYPPATYEEALRALLKLMKREEGLPVTKLRHVEWSRMIAALVGLKLIVSGSDEYLGIVEGIEGGGLVVEGFEIIPDQRTLDVVARTVAPALSRNKITILT